MNYIFIITIGFEGPAVATLVSQILINVIQLIFTSRVIGISFFNIFPWRRFGYITIVNFIFGLLFYYAKSVVSLNMVIGKIFESALIGMLWAGLYLIIFLKEIKSQWRNLNKSDE